MDISSTPRTELPFIVGGLQRPESRPPRRSFRGYWKQFRKEDVIMGYLFLLIPMTIFFIFLFLAMGFDFWMSFNTWNIFNAPQFVGSSNYNYIFTIDPVFWTAVTNSLTYAVIVVPVQTVLAFSLALIVNQNIRGKKFFRTTFYFPSVTSSVAITLLFMWMF
ncbi:MAG TPA: sugar ABC transporter permease, partial [Chloroflexota bacterium]|nr:sugar ABC transporter permease [Chloroflexota bacterium]